MANINLSQKSYIDYVASLYFKALGVVDVNFTPKVVKVGDKDVVLVHISGVQLTSGVKVNVDLFPRYDATEEDLSKLPKRMDDLVFRVGYWASINENGEKYLREGTPKWISYTVGTDQIKFSGGNREFGE